MTTNQKTAVLRAALAEKPISAVMAEYAAWLKAETGHDVDPLSVQLAGTLRTHFQKSGQAQARIAQCAEGAKADALPGLDHRGGVRMSGLGVGVILTASEVEVDETDEDVRATDDHQRPTEGLTSQEERESREQENATARGEELGLPDSHGSSIAVAPLMRQAVIDVVDVRLAEEVGADYWTMPASDGAHLGLTDGEDRALLWVSVDDDVSGFRWRGWVTADGRSCETLSEVEEAMAL